MSGSRDVDRKPALAPMSAEPRRAPNRLSGPTTSASQLMALQRSAGNAATVSLLNGALPGPTNLALAAPVLVVQRDIAPNNPLPDTGSIGQQRIEDRLTKREKNARLAAGFGAKLKATTWDEALVNKLVVDRRADMDAFYRKMYTKKHPTDPGKVDILVGEAVEKTVPSQLDTLLVQVNLDDLTTTPGLTSEMAKIAMKEFASTDGEVWLANALIETTATGNIAAVEAQLKRDAAAEWQRISGRAEGASFGQALSKAEKAAFSAQLKALPSLSRIAQAHGGDTSALKMTSAAGWRDGGYLSDTIIEVKEANDKKAIAPKDLYRRPIDDGSFRKRAFEADKMLRALVEPEILGQLAKPQLRVHPMKETKFRAFQSGEEVHLAADEPLPIMVHEVGHYLEDHGAIESWADIQRLISKRHQLAGGGAVTVTGPSGMRKEGRFAGEYKATGKYTSKAYDTGSTEMMAMTLEYLARPSTFEKMIEKDPLQAATVLRAVQPRAYAAQAGLRRFDKYLPS